MKTIIRTFRILNVGFLLGAAFIMWLYQEEIEGKEKETFPTKENTYA